jgi:hypothetical protein
MHKVLDLKHVSWFYKRLSFINQKLLLDFLHEVQIGATHAELFLNLSDAFTGIHAFYDVNNLKINRNKETLSGGSKVSFPKFI